MQVGIVAGGDHESRKFRMILKVNFCLQDKSTVSFLVFNFQTMTQKN